MITCVVCKQIKPEEDFNWRNKSQGLRKNNCKPCDREMKRRFYVNHREQVIAENVDRNLRKKQTFQSWKQSLSCCMCGETDEACLDFHHKDPTQKEFLISKLVTNSSFEKLKAELSKCVCVCANCHRKIHKYNLSVPDNAGVVFNG
jgi:hypothetical protein